MANKFYAGQSFLALWFVIHVPLCQAASRFDGIWRGTYNSQPTVELPNGTYPENVNRYELRLQETNGMMTGEFQRRGANSGPSRPVTNGKLFGDRACFDVVADDRDMRWCVLVRGNRLTGLWSNGPEAGPLLAGAGAGVRLFKINGRKIGSP